MQADLRIRKEAPESTEGDDKLKLRVGNIYAHVCYDRLNISGIWEKVSALLGRANYSIDIIDIIIEHWKRLVAESKKSCHIAPPRFLQVP